MREKTKQTPPSVIFPDIIRELHDHPKYIVICRGILFFFFLLLLPGGRHTLKSSVAFDVFIPVSYRLPNTEGKG